MKKSLILGFLILFTKLIHAQLYGNEWINFSQDYYKIKIGKEGIYRIDYNTLQNIGFPVNSINPQNIQMWINGKEQPIIVAGESDSKFDNSDFIEFYGTYNDGKLDAPLYNPGEQPHQYMSLYSDTAVYFLTVSGSVGKRIIVNEDKNYAGKMADPYFVYEQAIWFKNQAYDGLGFASEGFYSEYSEGEGWAISFGGGGTAVNFLTPYLSNLGPKPHIEVLAHSRANNVSAFDGDGNNNGLQLTVLSPNTLISEKKLRGLGRYFFNDSIDRMLVGSQYTGFKLTSFLLAKSNHSAAYFKFSYPRLFNLNDSSNFKFDYTSTNPFLKFQKYPAEKTRPILYDLTNFTKSIGEVNGSDLYCILPSSGSNRVLWVLDETSILQVSTVKAYKFNQLTPPSGADYLIITNQKLDSGANAYKDFLSTSTGGSHSVYLAFTNDIYDQFYYGLKHPEALKNFCRMSINNASSLKFLLLLGKGNKYINTRFNSSANESLDLVPTFGNPPSDYYFTTGYNGSKLDPLLATGRLPATTNRQVGIYLSNLNDHLSQGYQPWKKKILQLAGGENTSSVTQFVGYLTSYYSAVKGEKWGATRKLITKQDPSPIDSTLKSKIQLEINTGYALVDYFGHGSAQASDIDLGEAYQLSNANKYPFYYFNGCGLGNTFDGTSIAEGYLFTKKKGAIGWLAGTTFGYISELNHYANTFHQKLSTGTDYSFAQNLILTIKEYQNPSSDYNRSNCKQMLFMGDPSIKVFDANSPDYTIDVTKSYVYPKKATADLDSFGLVLSLKNSALFTNDTFTVHVQQNTPDNKILHYKSMWHHGFGNSDTLIFWIKRPKNISIKGSNTFTIYLDSANLIQEQLPFGESNNTASISYYFSSGNAQILFPKRDGIVSSTNVRLLAQSLNYTKSNYNFIFELDTTPFFSSPYKKSSGLITSQYLAEANFSLLPIDSLDYFWRVKIEDGSGKTVWDESTFAMIYNSPNGWSQGYIDKFINSQKVQLQYDNLKELHFNTVPSNNYQIWTGGKNCNSAFFYTIWHELPPLWAGFYTQEGICAVAINPFTERRFQTGSKYNVKSTGTWSWFEPSLTPKNKDYYLPAGIALSGAHTYSMANKDTRDSFISYLQRIPFGYHIMIFSGKNTNVDFWEEEIFSELEKFGAIKIRSLKNDHPYILVGQKGKIPGEAEEKLADYSSSNPPENQCITLTTSLNILGDSGLIKSIPIGPSSKWKSFNRTLHNPDNSSDNVKFNIYGLTTNGIESLLYRNITTNEFDLDQLDAKIYPFLRVEADIEDSVSKTPRGISRWTVLYDGYPEGMVNPPISIYQNKDSLDEGDTLQVYLAYSNISSLNMDSVLVLITNTNQANTIDTLEFKKYGKLSVNNSLTVKHLLNTKGLFGSNMLRVTVNPNMAQPEEYLFNNTWQFPYFIKTDLKNPYLDVVFDGRHISNFEIVSPNPTITITALDDNKYFYLDKADYFKLSMKEPGNTIFKNLNIASDTFNFIPSKGPNDKCKLIFNPRNLKDGVYELKVAVTDANGNSASEEDYKIAFQVISKSSLTNIYPYPNPFTTKTRFVFTLTGDQIPEYFKISIITASGSIVKELTQDELGPMNIGSNITKYEWDGTDSYGDKLANGVYLYKVSAKVNGKDIELSETAGDAFFKKGYGKLYIMR